MRVIALILAAGKGTRMRSARPKVLHALAGRPMILYVLDAARAAGADEALVVLGHEAREVRKALPEDTPGVIQEPPLGTAHAVQTALAALPQDGMSAEVALILYGDMPLITPETLRALLVVHAGGSGPLSLLSARVPDPSGYGRVTRDEAGRVSAIKEQKELLPHEEEIAEINCGVYAASLAWLGAALRELPRHPDGEYYLPDLVPPALAAGGVSVLPLAAVPGTRIDEVQGINTRVQLAAAERVMRARINERHMLAGVTLIDPTTTYIEAGVAIGADTTIHPGTHLRGATIIGADCQIGPDSEIADSIVEDGAWVARSVVEGARVGPGCRVGPFSHLRHGTVLHGGVEIGNYAEVKNSTLAAGSVSHHVSYIGDTTMGARVNVGAGTITANYDGTRKHRTTIGDDVSLGVGSLLRAPVTLGNASRTGAGAVVLHDVPSGRTVAGVPAREIGGEP